MINITVKNLSLTIENKLIFSGINAVFSSGNIYVIKGINGSGKTSLLRCICGVIPKHFDGNIQGSIEMLTTINYGYLMQEPEMQICFVFIEEELFFSV
jgi:ABC-type transport system involved in cytochrome c biogenesis ATPase subunit